MLGETGMEKSVKEAIRYLGFGRNAVDEQTLAMISDSFRELKQTASPKSIYRIFDFAQISDTKMSIGRWNIESASLAKNLKGCGNVILFGATLGSSVDRLIARYTVMDMAKTVVIQACAAAMLEEYCDSVQDTLREKIREKGKFLRPRFSPGYGDFDLCYQKPLMEMLDCSKAIGLTMTDSYMMIPTKSVTALIGVCEEETCGDAVCESCGKKDCIYRRGIL